MFPISASAVDETLSHPTRPGSRGYPASAAIPDEASSHFPSTRKERGLGGEVSTRFAVVPVKSFDMAKSRLESVLTLPERRELARSLMRTTVTALIDSACFHRVLVVSRDPEALAFATELGAEALHEEGPVLSPPKGPPGLNEALRSVRDYAIAEGATSLLVLFSDLPNVTPTDIRALADAATRTPIVIGPDRRLEGTNALLLSPPDAIDYHFGPNSFPLHLETATRAGLEATILHLPGVAHDIDYPEDLTATKTNTAPLGPR
jgi:2-phospho-L-lactate guanylyltransferase